MNTVDPVTLRQRRLVGAGALGLIVVVTVTLNSWGLNPVLNAFAPDEGTFTAGDPYGEWIYGVCDRETQQITVLRDGRLEGAAGLAALQRTRFPNWCGLPTVDNPELAAWRAQLARLQSLTASDAPAGEILEAARDMPVSVLYLQPLAQWIGASAKNSGDFLDALARAPMTFEHASPAIAHARRDNFAKLVHDAIGKAASAGITPEQAEAWLAADFVGDGRVVARLASVDGLSLGASAELLTRLERVLPHERADVYRRLAPRLVHEGNYAALLNTQLQFVPPHSRAALIRELLARQDASPQFAIALMTDFDRKFNDPQAELEAFTALADKLRDDPNAPLLLTMHLRDLQDMQRRMGATYLVGLDAADRADFTIGVLRAFADLHPISRPKVVYAVLQSEQFAQRAVQEASLLAVQLQVQDPDRRELLTAMRNHVNLETDLRPKIDLALGRAPGAF